MAEPHAVLKKALFAACAAWCLLWSSPASAEVQSNVPQEVRAFAETEGIAQVQSSSLDEQLSRAELGPGFPVYVVDEADWQEALGDSPLSVATPVEEWQFLVTVDGKPKTLMVVGKVRGKLAATRVGGSPNEIQGYLNNMELKHEQNPILLVSGDRRYLTAARGTPPFWSTWMGRVVIGGAIGAVFHFIRKKHKEAADMV